MVKRDLMIVWEPYSTVKFERKSEHFVEIFCGESLLAFIWSGE